MNNENAHALFLFETPAAQHLNTGEFWRSHAEVVDAEVVVFSGTLWLTSEGRIEDVILEAGDRFNLSGLKGVLLEGLSPSSFELV